MKKSKSSIIGKDDSLGILKLKTDKYLKIILMGSVVLSHDVESVESYTNDNVDFTKRLSFFETFRMEDDGLDDVPAIKLIRLTCFLNHLALTINKKSNFSIMSLMNTKAPQMSATLKVLSEFADFVKLIFKEMTEVIQSVAKDKQCEAEYLESIERRERSILKDIPNFETLNKIKDESLLKHEQSTYEHNKLIDAHNRLSKELSKEESQEMELQSILDGLKRVVDVIVNDLSKLRLLVVEDPLKLDTDLAELRQEIKNEEAKTKEYTEKWTLSELALQKAKLIETYKDHYYDNCKTLKAKFERLWNMEKEIASFNLPKTELIEDTKKDRENKYANVRNMVSKIKKEDQLNLATKQEELDLQIEIRELKNGVEMASLKAATYQMTQKEEIIQEKKKRKIVIARYKKGVSNLERNMKESTDELSEQYRCLSN